MEQIKKATEDDLAKMNDQKKAARQNAAKIAQAKIDEINQNKGLTSKDKQILIDKVTNDFNNVANAIDSSEKTSAIPDVSTDSDFAKSVQTDGYNDPEALQKAQDGVKSAIQTKYDDAQKALDAKKADMSTDAFNQAQETLNQNKAADLNQAAKAEDIDTVTAANSNADAHVSDAQKELAKWLSLVDKKTAEKAAVSEKAKEDRDAIDKMDDLSENQREKMKAAITAAEESINGRIDAVTSVDNLSSATNQQELTDQFNDAKQQEEVLKLSNKKKAANSLIDTKVNEANEAIDALANLSDDEKAAKKPAVKDASDKARQAIAAAKNSDDFDTVNKQLTVDADLKEATDAATKQDVENAAKKSLDEAKKATTAVLKKAAADAKAKIDATATLAKDDDGNSEPAMVTEADQQKKAIDDGLKQALAQVDAAADATALSGVQAGFDTTTPMTAVSTKLEQLKQLDDEKKAAKSAVEDKIKEAQKQLDSMSGLDEASKKVLEGKIQADAKKAFEGIEDKVAGLKQLVNNGAQATDLSDIVKHTNFDQDIKEAEEKVKAFAKAITDSKSAIDERIKVEKAKIDGMYHLTESEKEVAKKKLDEQSTVAKAAVDEGQTADQVYANVKASNFTVNVDQAMADLTGHMTLDEQKNAAKNAIDAQANQTKDAIDGRVDLSIDEKLKAKQAIDDAANQAKKQLDSINNADELNQSVAPVNFKEETDRLNQDLAHHDTLSEQKAAAKQAIDDKVLAMKTKIAMMTNLTDEQKAAAIAEIESAAAFAKNKIDAEVNADAVLADVKDLTFDHSSQTVIQRLVQIVPVVEQMVEKNELPTHVQPETGRRMGNNHWTMTLLCMLSVVSLGYFRTKKNV